MMKLKTLAVLTAAFALSAVIIVSCKKNKTAADDSSNSATASISALTCASTSISAVRIRVPLLPVMQRCLTAAVTVRLTPPAQPSAQQELPA